MSSLPSNIFETQLHAALQQRAAQALYRRRRITHGPQSVLLNVDGRDCISFCSNDYRGLANHPDVVKRFQLAANEYGVGSGASHLVSGHSAAHHALEEELADFVGRSRALLFSTGYMANIGVVSALMRKNHLIYEDKLNHASLIDAGMFSNATMQRYMHSNVKSLESLLQKTSANHELIVTDGVFSMDGDLAPLPQLVSLAKQYNASLMVDDAHGIGVLGENGQGTLEHFAVSQDDVAILMCTLGKAFGTFGAFIAGSDILIETLIQQSRTYIYTTALPAAIAEATRESLRLVKTQSWRRENLREHTTYFKRCAAQLGLALMPSDTAIQPLLVGDSATAVKLSEALFDQGILVTAIRPPTVPSGTARLRITFSAEHKKHHIDTLLDALTLHHATT